jgi:large subunit ribosomal protein L31e
MKERTYTIPLRREYLKVPKYKRAKKAITAVKEFLKKHMKAEDVKLGRELNLKIWENGIKNPPHHVKINVKLEDGVAKAELFGFEFKEKKMEKKKEPKNLKEKLSAKLDSGDKKESKKEEKKTEKKEDTKNSKKSEKKVDKKEEPKTKKEAPKKEN